MKRSIYNFEFKKVFLFTLLTVFAFVNSAVHAQEKSSGMMIFGVPQYLTLGGLRIDFDIPLKKPDKYLIVSPYFYNTTDYSGLYSNYDWDMDYDAHEYKDMNGYGLGLNQKLYLSSDERMNRLYFVFGGEYKHFNINGNGFTYFEEKGDDGLIYQQYGEIDYGININAFSAQASIGIQMELMERLYMDIYTGIGMKYSTHSSPEKVTIKYNRGMGDYGYTGTLFVFCFRIGVML